ncbi:MAG: hypothetical protein QME58_05180 [Bacteroidota bacterium]|nr:hypothetical protein [Bacteroidota bacterium]
MTKQVKILFLTLLFLLGGIALQFTSCRKTPTEPSQPGISLEAEDVAVTEVWLRVRTQAQSGRLTLFRNDSIIVTIPDSLLGVYPANGGTLRSGLDTLIVDEGLLPKHTYTYKLTRTLPFGLSESTRLTVTTMDTTSHNFTWEIDTLGDGASSVLYDVAIINDTLAYAVGEIYKRDSTGQFEVDPYNVAKWDGKKWHLLKVSFRDYGNPTVWPGVLKAVYGFSADNIYVASSANLLKWNGTSWQEKAFFMTDISWNGRVKKIWGSSENYMHLVGDNGAIYFFNGVSWRRLESGTDVDLTDIWGTQDEQEIWTCGWNWQGGSVIIRKHGSSWQTVWNGQTPTPPYLYKGSMSTLWSAGRTEFLIASGDLFRHSFLNTSILRFEIVITPSGWYRFNFGNFPYRLRGTASNNIIAVGDGAMVWHFNGRTWFRYEQLRNENDRLYGLAVLDNLIVAVGTRYGEGPFRYALVIRGSR